MAQPGTPRNGLLRCRRGATSLRTAGPLRILLLLRTASPLLLAFCAVGQMQFEIPPEMLAGLMGGGMMGGGGGRQVKPTEWPKTENSEVSPEFEWIINTEWKGRTAKYSFLRGGVIESPLKECEQEGQCLWAANNERVLINTPTLKVIKFKVVGLDKADKKKLENKDETELKNLRLETEKPGKSGKKSLLDFVRVAVADESENIIARDLYAVLEVPEDVEQSAVKSKYRRLSVQHHPDKGGDPKLFNEIREAYEVLGDKDNRRYYDIGGMQLVKNVELAFKEVEGQKAQLDAQLTKVPKNHPQYAQFKAQIDAQKKQFEGSSMRHDIEKKMRGDEIEVYVPISAQELYNGVGKKPYTFQRSVICRGCRADPDGPQCRDCGRCPPEKVQKPKYGMTPFGKQVVGMVEVERESRERCREVGIPVPDLRVPKGAKHGSTLRYVSDIGHQTPGKLPGKVVFKVQRGSANDTYTIAESDLHTVLHISLEQALFGFSISWTHLGDEKVTVSQDHATHPDEVLRLKKKGLVHEGGSRGDLFIRLAVDMPQVSQGSREITLKASASSAESGEAHLEREDPVELREGAAWRQWRQREAALSGLAKASKASGGKQEL